jgi:hypothetical protein
MKLAFARFPLASLVAVAGALLTGCGDDGGTGTGSGGGSTAGECAPDVGCPTVPSDCVAFEDNAGKDTFALRITQLTIEKPAALTDPTVKNLLAKGVTFNYQECTAATGDPLFTGDGTFSWILEFDKTNGTLRTGGAKPEPDPNAGYCFVNEKIGAFEVAPLSADAPIGADGSFAIAQVRDVVVPIYTDVNDPTKVILLPLRGVKIYDAVVSADNNCIGSFNANLDPNNLCLPDNETPQFIDGARLDGYVTLEEADQVEVPELGGKSLCTLIAGPNFLDDTMKKCRRDGNGAIEFKGDWCAGAMEGDPGKAADASCADAVQLAGGFAASGAKVRTDCP